MARVGALVCLMALLGLARTAGADEDPGIGEAERHLQALEYQEAASVLERLLRRGGSDRATTARAYELLGAAAASSGEEAQAIWAYQRLLALTPAYQQAEGASPRLAGALARARDELPHGAVVQVRLELPAEAIAGRPMSGSLVASSDALGLVRGVKLKIRRGTSRVVSSVVARGASPVEFVVPATDAAPGTRLRIEAVAIDEHGNEVAAAPAVTIPVAARATHGRASGAETAPQPTSSNLFAQWWFWAGVVVLAAGAAVAGVVLLGQEPDCQESTVCYEAFVRVVGAAR